MMLHLEHSDQTIQSVPPPAVLGRYKPSLLVMGLPSCPRHFETRAPLCPGCAKRNQRGNLEGLHFDRLALYMGYAETNQGCSLEGLASDTLGH